VCVCVCVCACVCVWNSDGSRDPLESKFDSNRVLAALQVFCLFAWALSPHVSDSSDNNKK
jgi:hypothetical protein